MTATDELRRLYAEGGSHARIEYLRSKIKRATIAELRKLLRERGVRFNEFKFTTQWAGALGESVEAYPIDMFPDALLVKHVCLTPAQAIAATLGPTVTGETSDGYHTFNELYHHRAVLFSVIVRDRPDLAWKSKLHSDGTMYDGMFIVGIQTPQGQATYHYDIDPYWEMFDCRELERAPEWDGHTPEQAIERIATLGAGTCHYEIAFFGDGKAWFACSECGGMASADYDPPKYCPNCGRKVVGE